MKSFLLAFFVSAAFFRLCSEDAIRIMPLGNSITESMAGRASYRCWLWKMLVDSGYAVDFVGYRKGVFQSPPSNQTSSACPYADFDEDHEGHTSWRASQILYGCGEGRYCHAGKLSAWAYIYKPDIVLVHLGTNDLTLDEKASPDSVITLLGAVVDTLRAYRGDVKIFLAKIIPYTFNGFDTKIIDSLNAKIPALADLKTTASSPVLTVDCNAGFTADDSYDGIHPNQSGERKMAARFFAAIDSLPRQQTNNAGYTTPPLPAGADIIFKFRADGALIINAGAMGPGGREISLHTLAGALVYEAELRETNLTVPLHARGLLIYSITGPDKRKTTGTLPSCGFNAMP
jgi:acyl-CoA thioesterase I